MQLNPQSGALPVVRDAESISLRSAPVKAVGVGLRARLRRILDIPWLSFAGRRRDPDRFVDQVGHELKTPLTSIRSLSEILRDNPMLPPKMREQYLKIILGESHRLESVVSVLLDGLSDPDVMNRPDSRESLLDRIATAVDQARRQGSAS